MALTPGDRPADVLFVCVHNAGRSQMAKAFFNHIAAERGLQVRAESAGTEPGDRVHKVVAEAMEEVGLDISAVRPQLLTDAMAEPARRVITMGCQVDADRCPAIFLRDVVDWGLPDPSGLPLDEARRVRDEVRRRAEALIDELAGP